MEYDKNRFQKTDDKKVLHKVKKQWVILSMSLLVALGGGAAIANHTNVDADSNSNSQASAKSPLKERLDQSLSNERQNVHQNNNQPVSAVNAANVLKQAKILHNRIFQNADLKPDQNTSHLQAGVESTNHLNHTANQPDLAKVSSQQIKVLKNHVGSVNTTKISYQDSSVPTDSDQPSPVSNSTVSTGASYADSIGYDNYYLDSLSVGSYAKADGNHVTLNVTKVTDNSVQTFSNEPYTINYQNVFGNAENAYNYTKDSLGVRTSDGIATSALSGQIGTTISGHALVNSLGIQAAPNADDYQITTSDAATITPTGVQWTDGNDQVVSDPAFTAKANAKGGQIVVHLINQSGRTVPFASGVPNNNGINNGNNVTFTGDGVGDTINIVDAVKSEVPAQYSLAAGQYSDYTFSDHAQNAYLMVKGKSDAAASVKINLKYIDHNNSSSANHGVYRLSSLIASGEATVNHSGSAVNYGDVITINPSAAGFQKNGFTINNNDSSLSAVHLYVGNNGSLYDVDPDTNQVANLPDTKTHQFSYSENANVATSAELNEAQTSVEYLNQEGAEVKSATRTNFGMSDYGRTVDLTDSKGGVTPPAGYDLNYSLDDNNATKYTVGKSSNQLKTLYVIGKLRTTNQDPNYNLPIQIGTGILDNPDDRQFSYRNKIMPKITGRIGSSVIISASDFLDNNQINGLNATNYGLNYNDKEYRLIFNPSGLLVKTVDANDPDNVNKGRIVHPTLNDDDNGIHFDYVRDAGSGSVPKLHTIRINYLYNDKNYVKNGTPTQKWIQLPGTTVSDKDTKTADSFSIDSYEKNPPQGYQFVRVLNVNPNGKVSDDDSQPSTNSDGTPVENNLNTKTQNVNTTVPTTFSHDAVINLEVIPIAGDITVQYYNQNGKQLAEDGSEVTSSTKVSDKQDVIAGNPSNQQDHGANSRYGQYLNLSANDHEASLIDDQGNNFHLWHLPKGYHLVQDPTVNNDSKNGYQFTREPQVIKLTVIGNDVDTDSSKNLVHLQIRKERKDGAGDNSITPVTTYAHGRIGNSVNIDPSNFAPAGYHATASDHPFKVDLNADGSVDHHYAPIWNYVSIVPSDETPFNINVNYVDQKGQSVNNGGVRVNGYYGEHFSGANNITKYATIPSGYELNASDVVNYTLGSGQASRNGNTVSLRVHGDRVNNDLSFKVYRVYTDANGRRHLSDTGFTTVGELKNNHVQDDVVGNSFTVNPSDYNPDKNNYSDDLIDAPVTINVVPASNGDGAALSADQVVFFYNHKNNGDVEAQPIVVRYVNEKTGQQIGTNDVINGKYGKSIKIVNGNVDASDNLTGQHNRDVNWQVPKGYTASNAGKQDVPFGSDIQNVYINVDGDQVSDQVIVHQIYRNPNGTLNHQSDQPVNLRGQIGDTFTVSPYDKIDSGYHAVDSDNDAVITLGTNGHLFINGNYIANDDHTCNIGYVYDQNYRAPSHQLDTITVHYLDGDTEVDHEYDHGMAGKSFNVAPYENDVPNDVNDRSYYYDANATRNDPRNKGVDRFKNTAVTGNESDGGFQQNNQNVYIHLGHY